MGGVGDLSYEHVTKAGNREVAAENPGICKAYASCCTAIRHVALSVVYTDMLQNVGRCWLSSWPDRQAAFAALHGAGPHCCSLVTSSLLCFHAGCWPWRPQMWLP